MSPFVFPIVAVGHVDHGKSTIVGHLLSKLGSLPDGKIERIKSLCEKQNRPFEYAFILDALREEQKQGITIDTARIFFSSAKRAYQLLDAPGHVAFVKNMVTGAAKAEAALLVVDAMEGIQENSRRHAYLLSFLGVCQIAVLINKMDGVNYSEQRYQEIKAELSQFLQAQNVKAQHYIPVSGLLGDNLVEASSKMSWWQGPTVAQALDSFTEPTNRNSLPLRTFVQDVYKFTSAGADQRIVVGLISSGSLQAGDEVTVWPSQEKTTVLSLQALDKTPAQFSSNENASFILKDALFVTRGNLLTASKNQKGLVSGKHWKADIFWLGQQSLQLGRTYIIRHGSLKSLAVLEKIEHVLDTSDLTSQDVLNEVQRNQAAQVIFTTTEPLTVDLSPEQQDLTRFVIIDNYEISGGGKILEVATAVTTKASWRVENNFSTCEGLHEKYLPHTLLIQVGKKSSANKLAGLLSSYYRAASVPHLTLSLDELNIYDLPTIQSHLEGAHLAGAVALVFVLDAKDESLRTLQHALAELRPVTASCTGERLHFFPADIIISSDLQDAVTKVMKVLETKKLLLK